jgi:hypothetical protein
MALKKIRIICLTSPRYLFLFYDNFLLKLRAYPALTVAGGGGSSGGGAVPTPQNYWPIVNGSVSDVVSGNDLIVGLGTPTLTTDRFGNAQGAFTNSPGGTNYYRTTGDVSFNGDFTVSAWVMPNSVTLTYLCKLKKK